MNTQIPKNPKLNYMSKIIKIIFELLFLSAIVFLILSAINWNFDPGQWGGFSRFLGIVAFIILLIGGKSALDDARIKYIGYKNMIQRDGKK
ncbi:MAG: hypothetical protein HC836_39290 [Richelia sp. RM2_1_2]|nr:hypothetical protein [Richelia sp. RM2_1_2]